MSLLGNEFVFGNRKWLQWISPLTGLADPKFFFYDHSLVEAIKLELPDVHAFFRLLALCHTAMAEEKRRVSVVLYNVPYLLAYVCLKTCIVFYLFTFNLLCRGSSVQAQSPDEGALVTARA